MSAAEPQKGNPVAFPASFEVAWAATANIPGWLEENEARHLYQAAMRVPADQCIVDIGTYQGRTSVLLAHTGRQIVTIDPMTVGHDPANRITISEEDVSQLAQRLASFPNITWLKKDVDDCQQPYRQVGLLHIDGDHSYPRPRLDFDHFREWLVPIANVAFHDYGVFPGVARSVDDLRSERVIEEGKLEGSMYITSLPPSTSPTQSSVTGFHLVALCHRFGRRGRAFAASLANQQDNPYEMHLTVFYCEPTDAILLSQGCTSGPNPPTLTLTHVPIDNIMQRAMHFSSITNAPNCSHTVFLDADLWFAPDFWSQYGAAISRKAAGYWSCLVQNIPQAESEGLLENWESLTELQLRNFVSDVRYDSFQGRVGHFQCIPAGMTRYPIDRTQAVDQTDEVFARTALVMSVDQRQERRLSTPHAFHFDHPRCWTGTSELL